MSNLTVGTGKFPENVLSHLTSKSSFIRAFSKHDILPWLSSDALMKNMADNLDLISSFIPDGTQIEKLSTNINRAALDLGIAPGYNGTDDDFLEEGTLRKSVYDCIMQECYHSINNSYEKHKLTRGIKFNITSSVGVATSSESSPLARFNCSHDIEAKHDIAIYTKDCDSDALFQPMTIGFRLQLESWLKANSRRCQLVKDGKIVDSTVANDFHGQRGRHVIGVPEMFNAQPMIIGSYLLEGLTSTLQKMWKFTPESLLIDTKGKFISTFDVVNNDQSFNAALNKRIHKDLLPQELYEVWDNLQNQGTLHGVYRDRHDEEIYYTMESYKMGLLSGEAFTSITNKIGHTLEQVTAYLTVHKKQKCTPELLAQAAQVIINNGDDLLNVHDDPKERDSMQDLLQDSKIANYEIEPNMFSGQYFPEKNDNGEVFNASSTFATLFFGLLQRERRSWDNRNLGILPYNSLLGRTQWMRLYPPAEDSVVDDAIATFFSIAEFDGDENDLVAFADKELVEAEQEGDNRAMAIMKLSKAMGLKNANDLWYKFSYEELEKVDKESAEQLFLRIPAEKFARNSVVDFLSTRK